MKNFKLKAKKKDIFLYQRISRGKYLKQCLNFSSFLLKRALVLYVCLLCVCMCVCVYAIWRPTYKSTSSQSSAGADVLLLSLSLSLYLSIYLSIYLSPFVIVYVCVCQSLLHTVNCKCVIYLKYNGDEQLLKTLCPSVCCLVGLSRNFDTLPLSVDSTWIMKYMNIFSGINFCHRINCFHNFIKKS